MRSKNAGHRGLLNVKLLLVSTERRPRGTKGEATVHGSARGSGPCGRGTAIIARLRTPCPLAWGFLL